MVFLFTPDETLLNISIYDVVLPLTEDLFFFFFNLDCMSKETSDHPSKHSSNLL